MEVAGGVGRVAGRGVGKVAKEKGLRKGAVGEGCTRGRMQCEV